MQVSYEIDDKSKEGIEQQLNMSISPQQMFELQAAEVYIENEYNIQLLLTVATKQIREDSDIS